MVWLKHKHTSRLRYVVRQLLGFLLLCLPRSGPLEVCFVAPGQGIAPGPFSIFSLWRT